MKICIVISHENYAGLNILESLKKYDLDKFDSFVYETKKNSIDCEDIDKEIEADIFVFATTHRSASGTNSLTTHFPGNFGKAELGGKEGQLNVSASRFLRDFYLELKSLNSLDYEVSVEADHHGPYLSKPCIFIEIGSGEKQWKDSEAGKVIADAIFNVVSRGVSKRETVLVVGGGHYNQLAMKVLEKTGYHIGHICAKHSLEGFNSDTFKQMLDRCMDKVSFVVLDWKGLGEYKDRVIEVIEKEGVKWKKWKDIK